MKILHVIRDLAVATGGPVTALGGLAEAEARRGHEVMVLTTDHGEGERARPDGVELETVTAWKGAWSYAPGFGRALERQVPRADIVHLHMVWDYPVWAGARAATRHGKPFILRPCGQLDRWSLLQKEWKKRAYRATFSAQLRKAAAIHFTTEGERVSSRPAIGGIASFVIPMGVPERAYVDLPPQTAFFRRFPQLVGRRLVLFLGRLHPKKQPDLLIDAFARIAGTFPAANLVLAGPAEEGYLATLRTRARSRGVWERTTFTGPLVGAAVTEAYRAAEVFALPSLQENFGIAVVEAMAARCSVLVSDRLDLAAGIGEAGAGIVRPATAEAFAEGLHTLLADPALSARMGVNGHRLVLRNYTWDPIAERIIDAYRRIIRRIEQGLRESAGGKTLVW